MDLVGNELCSSNQCILLSARGQCLSDRNSDPWCGKQSLLFCFAQVIVYRVKTFFRTPVPPTVHTRQSLYNNLKQQIY